jgi:hypothetical protein
MTITESAARVWAAGIVGVPTKICVVRCRMNELVVVGGAWDGGVWGHGVSRVLTIVEFGRDHGLGTDRHHVTKPTLFIVEDSSWRAEGPERKLVFSVMKMFLLYLPGEETEEAHQKRLRRDYAVQVIKKLQEMVPDSVIRPLLNAAGVRQAVPAAELAALAAEHCGGKEIAWEMLRDQLDAPYGRERRLASLPFKVSAPTRKALDAQLRGAIVVLGGDPYEERGSALRYTSQSAGW